MKKRQSGISVSARKAKGRRLQQYVRDLILEAFPVLTPDDVRSTPMGVSGTDVQLSPLAQTKVPLSIECKNREDFGNSIMWDAISQSERNSGDNIPVVIFKKNRTKTYAIIEAKILVDLLKK